MNLLKILDGTPEPPIIDLDLGEINYSGDYHLPTPMYEFQKELTDQIVSLHYPDILKYCETNDSRDLIVKSLEICIENCMLVATHPYLLINHYMPKNLSMKDMPNKLADTSGKFTVLKDLMNVIIQNTKQRPKHIGVVMKNSLKFFDLVEALLLRCTGNKIIKRYIGNNVQRESKKNSKSGTPLDLSGSPTTIHLLPHDGQFQRDEEGIPSIRFDALIVFDGYVDTETEFFQKIRTQNRRSECIIIRLVPMKTIEHCKLFYNKETDKEDYLYKLISSIVCLRDHIGTLPPDVFPIYNQKLTYLSHKFFDEVFKSSVRTGDFPGWPLPALPRIPKFTAIDVERSLLTEVHFHYTPYDAIGTISGDQLKSKQEVKPTFYETRRLELEYITNPLKNSYTKLTGIHSGEGEEHPSTVNTSILTHKLILQLNDAFLCMDRAEAEDQSYVKFNEHEIQEKAGRREREMRIAVSKIFNDIDHAESRVNSANKWIIKKTEHMEKTKEKCKDLESKIANFLEENKIEDEKTQQYIKNQVEIWELQTQTKDLIKKIQSKNEERNYATKEYQNCLRSIAISETEIEEYKNRINESKRKYAELEESEEQETRAFNQKKQKLIDQIEEQKRQNESLRSRLNHSFKFLRDTSHLKKRKGRGGTPNK